MQMKCKFWEEIDDIWQPLSLGEIFQLATTMDGLGAEVTRSDSLVEQSAFCSWTKGRGQLQSSDQLSHVTV
jgi:hypothetical protein